MPETGVEEKSVIEKAIAGDAHAFGVLYERYLEAIYRYVYFRVKDGADAEDLTEQVFLQAWEALPNYKHQGHPFTSWLYRIAHNNIVDFYRRSKHTAVVAPAEQISHMKWGGMSEPNSLEQLIAAEETDALAEAISQLPEVQQEVIILRFIEGLDHDTVANIVDKSNGACRTIQYRALAALNQLLTSEKAGAL